MMTIVVFLIFGAAFSAVASVFAYTLVPAMPRIAAVLRGEADPVYAARPMLVLSENRVRARIRSVAPVRPMGLRVAA